MDDRVSRVAELLREAAQLHHRVYRISDGAHDDWPSWYAQWLVNLSELPDVLGTKVGESEMVYVLVKLGKEYAEEPRQEAWPDYYAREIVAYFAGP